MNKISIPTTPKKIIFCKKCVISNQRPNSSVEMKNSGEKKQTIEFNKNGKNRFDLNFSLLFNEINNPIKLKGFVPSSKNGIVDLNLTGKRELLKLIDVFYGDNINFKQKIKSLIKIFLPNIFLKFLTFIREEKNKEENIDNFVLQRENSWTLRSIFKWK